MHGAMKMNRSLVFDLGHTTHNTIQHNTHPTSSCLWCRNTYACRDETRLINRCPFRSPSIRTHSSLWLHSSSLCARTAAAHVARSQSQCFHLAMQLHKRTARVPQLSLAHEASAHLPFGRPLFAIHVPMPKQANAKANAQVYVYVLRRLTSTHLLTSLTLSFVAPGCIKIARECGRVGRILVARLCRPSVFKPQSSIEIATNARNVASSLLLISWHFAARSGVSLASRNV